MNVLTKSELTYREAKGLAGSIYDDCLSGKGVGVHDDEVEVLRRKTNVLLVNVNWHKELRFYRWLGEPSFLGAKDRTHRNVRKARTALRTCDEMISAYRAASTAEQKYWSVRGYESDLTDL